MTPQQKDIVVHWVKQVYAARTKLIEQDQGKIDWLHPGTRVSLTEMREYAASRGINLNVNDITDILNSLQLGKRHQ